MSDQDLSGVRIVLLIAGHLANAPRPQKEAALFAGLGAKVSVLGMWSNEKLANEDVQLAASMVVDFLPVYDLRTSNSSSFFARLKFRLARELLARFGISSKYSLGVGIDRLLGKTKELRPDLVIVHCESGLWVGKKLLKSGYRVAVDFEDWFSRDLLESDRVGRPVKLLASLERYLLHHAHACYTTSNALAIAMGRDAGAKRIPAVVPNCFPASERIAASAGQKDERASGAVSFHWFSQTIGPGRGLELLAESLLRLNGNWEVCLRGNVSAHRAWFEATFSSELQDRVRLLEPVSNTELLSRTMSHDVGMALEVPYCESRALTATNKIYEYLRAGLAVIATETEGQIEVLKACPDAGTMISANDAASLAAAMQAFIDDNELLKRCRSVSWSAGADVWSWERHQTTLINAVMQALRAPDS